MRRLVPSLLALLLSSQAMASDWFVVTGVYAKQEDAWRASAEMGGWVLDHDVYNALKPERYSLVRGPFRTSKEARQLLKKLQRSTGYEQAYVKEAGDLQLPEPLGAPGTPPIAIAALLGELDIRLEDREGGHAPCVPATPHWVVTLRGRNVLATEPPVARADEVALPSQLAIDKATGEVLYLTGCATEPEPEPPAEPEMPEGEEGAEAQPEEPGERVVPTEGG
jgi:hypothetical protein